MSKANTNKRPKARLAKGFRDIEAPELKALNDMIGKIRDVYERYGFEALETPAIEYTDALGKFLPDQDRPNAGVFSFQDEDEQWMSLRYDLTAPLARYVAQNFQTLPKPFRRYAFGNVYRNEKPGPGRFRQFMQFDADTVGAASVAADAELCMLAADTLEALGVKRGDYVIKVNNRKVLDGVMEAVGLEGADNAARRLIVLRAIDKFDRLGVEGVRLLLGEGRWDGGAPGKGDFSPGAKLQEQGINAILNLLAARPNAEKFAIRETRSFNPVVKFGYEESSEEDLEELTMTAAIARMVSGKFSKNRPTENYESEAAKAGVAEIEGMHRQLELCGYDDGRIIFDPSVVRGLEYYTGPVFEAELTFEIKGDDGKPVRFGSVGGGGRYDDLIARFTGQQVAATGFSIGVSRLQAALSLINESKIQPLGPVVVLVMDKDADSVAGYQKMTQALRNAGIRAEMYLGNAKSFGDQIKYADKRNSPCVIIQGSDERAKGEVTIKDLIEGAKAAAAIKDNKEWKETRPAQFSVSESRLVQEVHNIIKRHQE